MLLSEQSSQKGKLTALPDILPGEFVSALAIPPNLRQFVRSRAEQGSRQFIPQARTPQKTARIATLTLEQISFLKGRTVLDNVTHPYELAGLHCQIANRLADQLLRQLGLEREENQLPERLHPVQQLKLRLGCAIAHNPVLLVLEDSFDAIDPSLRNPLLANFLDLWERERPSVLHFTTRPDDALLLADRILLPSGSSKLLAEFKPPFPRPRNLGLLEESEFAALKARLSASLFLTNAAFEPEYFI